MFDFLQISSLVISQPLDVIKTRIQNQNFDGRVGGMTLVRELIRNEGPSAFFKVSFHLFIDWKCSRMLV